MSLRLTKLQKQLCNALQDGLPICSRPFAQIAKDLNCDEKTVLQQTSELKNAGVIRRIAAVVDHRKLGFVANVLFCSEVPQDRIVEAGKKLARFGMVSHCYERETFENWPYNLFAMIHGRSMGRIRHVINKFIEAERIDSFQLLPTAAEFRKEPVEHEFY